MSHLPVEAGVQEINAAVRRTGRHWLDLTLALSAIFISTISLIVAIEHGFTERELVAASSWPFLQAQTTDHAGGKPAVVVAISNSGTGPAKIYGLEVSFDGRPVSDPSEILHRCCGADAVKRTTVQTASVDGTVMRPGENNDFLVLPMNEEDAPVARSFLAAVNRITLRACYCSALDRCWITKFDSLNVTRVPSCQHFQHVTYHPHMPNRPMSL